MNQSDSNRFQEFFEEDKYILLKNYLYNYLLRKSAVEKSLQKEEIKLALEIGSGISPVMTQTDRIIYSDLSFGALQILKRTHENKQCVVADGMNLPFKPSVFSHAICSEVLEHLQDDRKALNELSRVMNPSGIFIVTVPHRKLYFSNDDRFVKHFRRYEILELEEKLRSAGLVPMHIQKILGPLEKVTMSFVVFCFSILQKLKSKSVKAAPQYRSIQFFTPLFKWANRLFMGLVWLDARMMPRALAAVLLVKAQKKQYHTDINSHDTSENIS